MLTTVHAVTGHEHYVLALQMDKIMNWCFWFTLWQKFIDVLDSPIDHSQSSGQQLWKRKCTHPTRSLPVLCCFFTKRLESFEHRKLIVKYGLILIELDYCVFILVWIVRSENVCIFRS